MATSVAKGGGVLFFSTCNNSHEPHDLDMVKAEQVESLDWYCLGYPLFNATAEYFNLYSHLMDTFHLQ